MLSELILEGGGGGDDICVVERLPQGPRHMEIPQCSGIENGPIHWAAQV